MSECPKCKKLESALKDFVEYKDWQHMNGKLSLYDMIDRAKTLLAEHAKDSPVSAPKFDEKACFEAWNKGGLGSPYATFFNGANWQFSQWNKK